MHVVISLHACFVCMRVCSCSSKFNNPQYPDGHVFEAKLLPGAELPAKMLKPENFFRNYRPKFGFGNSTPAPRQYSTPESAQRTIRYHKQKCDTVLSESV